MARHRGTLVFDGDCGICSSIARLAVRILGGRGRVVPYQRADLASLGLTTEQGAEAAWWVDASGRRFRGHLAAARALRAAGGAWTLLGRGLETRTLSRPAAVAYEWIARNRHRLPGGTPACRPDRRG